VKSEVRLSCDDGNQTSFDFAGTECTIPVIILWCSTTILLEFSDGW
jgi:hypothetical protein